MLFVVLAVLESDNIVELMYCQRKIRHPRNVVALNFGKASERDIQTLDFLINGVRQRE